MTISLADSDVFTSLRAFLLVCIPSGMEVVKGQDNGVPMPAGNFCTMTPKSNGRIETNTVTYTDPVSTIGTSNNKTASEFVVQLDFYGSNSANNAKIVETLARSEFAYSQFTNIGIKPLYAEDPIQIPLINGEEQYEQRWKMDFHMQYNPVVTTPQDFAGTLAISTVSVERAYPA